MTLYIDADELDKKLHRFSFALTQKILKEHQSTFLWTRSSGERLTKDWDEYRVPLVPEIPENAHEIVYKETRKAFSDLFSKENDNFLLEQVFERLFHRLTFFDLINNATVSFPKFCIKDIEMMDRHESVPLSQSFNKELHDPQFFQAMKMSEALDLVRNSKEKHKKSIDERLKIKKSLSQMRDQGDEVMATMGKMIDRHENFEHHLYFAQVKRFLHCKISANDLEVATRQSLRAIFDQVTKSPENFLILSRMEDEIFRNKRLSEYVLQQTVDQKSLSFFGEGSNKFYSLVLLMTKAFKDNARPVLANLFSLDLFLTKDFAKSPQSPENDTTYLSGYGEGVEFFSCTQTETRQNNYQTSFIQKKIPASEVVLGIELLAKDLDERYKNLLTGDADEAIERAERVAEHVLNGARDNLSRRADFWAETHKTIRDGQKEHDFQKWAPDIFFAIFQVALDAMRQADNFVVDKNQLQKDLEATFLHDLLVVKSSFGALSEQNPNNTFDQTSFADTLKKSVSTVLSLNHIAAEDSLRLTAPRAKHR